MRTDVARVLHSGDWKLDPKPVLGQPTDVDGIKAFAAEGVDALICDSTNALRDGFSPSETDVAKSLVEIIKGAKHRVIVTTFASNLGRVIAVADAARAAGRQLVVVGRALLRVVQVGIETGYLPQNFKYLEQREYGYLERDEVVALVTGSQGEPRAAMARIAEDSHPDISVHAGDLVIFSSRNIPGNEADIGDIQNALSDLGCEILTDSEALVHVTGHPRRGELERMYDWVKPRIAIPMHGEARHLERHAQLAREKGVETVLSIRNGDMVRIAPGPVKVIDDVPTGRQLRDGRLIVPSDTGPVRERRKLSFVGIIVVSLVMSRKGELMADPQVVLDGIAEEDAEGELVEEIVLDAVGGAIASIPKQRRKDLAMVQEAAQRAARSACDQATGKRPICKVILNVI
jgi:ribonuclease J